MPARPRPAGRVFDEVVVVDFSAAATPVLGPNSIWVAHRGAPGARRARQGRPETANLATRAEAQDHVGALLARAAAKGRTALVAVDFSLGYPAGFAECTRLLSRATGVSPPPWRRTWDLLAALVTEGPDNANNRFEAADRINERTGLRLFWGRPGSARFEALRSLPPVDRVPAGLAANPCAPLRVTERAAGRGIRSNFQLFGGVTVGGQVLVGIPWLDRLLRRFRDLAVVWPFETGFGPDPLGPPGPGVRPGRPDGRGGRPRRASFVFAELWPSSFVRAARPPSDPVPAGPSPARPAVRDEAQVIAAADACGSLDAAGWATWFDPPAVSALPAGDRSRVLREEGWILGVR